MINPQDLRTSVDRAVHSGEPQFHGTYRASETYDENEFLAFIKPEITGLRDTLPDALELINSAFDAYGVRIGATATLPSNYLAAHRLIASHYGTINRVSRLGALAFGPEAQENFSKLTAELSNRIDPLGAHQFLDRYAYFSPASLAVLFDNLSSRRLAGGTHGVLVSIEGEHFFLLNGFHPAQLQHFEKPDRAIFCMIARSPTSWRRLRRDMTGATDPSKAVEGSIRSTLLQAGRRLGLGSVTSLTNGIHVSAGPVEAGVEIARYFSDWSSNRPVQPIDTTVGKLLQAAVDPALVDALFEDAVVRTPAGERSAFDATEECDLADLVEVVSDFSI